MHPLPNALVGFRVKQSTAYSHGPFDLCDQLEWASASRSNQIRAQVILSLAVLA